MIYENQFSDFLIMYDYEQEIKSLTSDEWRTIVREKSIKNFSHESI